jgi:hypothetical protein
LRKAAELVGKNIVDKTDHSGFDQQQLVASKSLSISRRLRFK